jgi:hypothetical protein
MRTPAEIQAEVASLTAQIREPQREGVTASLVAAREALEWAAGLANCRPTDFIIEPPSEFDVIELGERAAKALSRAERIKAGLVDTFLGGLSAAQLDGLACAYCHKAAPEGVPMVPLRLAGTECAASTLFVCRALALALNEAADGLEAKLLEGWAE